MCATSFIQFFSRPVPPFSTGLNTQSGEFVVDHGEAAFGNADVGDLMMHLADLRSLTCQRDGLAVAVGRRCDLWRANRRVARAVVRALVIDIAREAAWHVDTTPRGDIFFVRASEHDAGVRGEILETLRRRRSQDTAHHCDLSVGM